MQHSNAKQTRVAVCGLRGGGHKAEAFVAKQSAVRILDRVSKSQRQIARVTFSAELLSAGDAIDQGLLIAQMLCEIAHGPLTATEARQRRASGGHIPVALCMDAMSAFAAVIGTVINILAGKSFLCHVQCVCELLDRKVLRRIVCVDISESHRKYHSA
jgi:hypothetical protein